MNDSLIFFTKVLDLALMKVKISRSEYIEIDSRNFTSLLDIPGISSSSLYQNTLIDDEITIRDLRSIARKAYVPYPLFFSPYSIVEFHLRDFEKQVFSKMPSKGELSRASRGELQLEDIKLIAADISRKQMLLKSRIFDKSYPKNSFLGSAAPLMKRHKDDECIATFIKGKLGIKEKLQNAKNRTELLDLFMMQSEKVNVLVSMSSHNYMPQNLKKDAVSGFCVKDDKFPCVFLNVRDGEKDPLILETEGRQIFTLCAMLVAISLGSLALGNNPKKSDIGYRIYRITGAVLISENDKRLPKKKLVNADEVDYYARLFHVSKSMILERFKQLILLDKPLYDEVRQKLRDSIKVSRGGGGKKDKVKLYAKYNGKLYSELVCSAYLNNKLSRSETRSALFPKGRATDAILNSYVKAYGK